MAATGPFTTESIALTEKKMDMTLDDIIRMSKNGTLKIKQKWVPVQNKSQSGSSGNIAGEKIVSKVGRFLDMRSSIRQGFFNQRRSSFWGDRFPASSEVARKAAAAPFRNRAYNNRTVNRYPYRFADRPVQRKSFTWGLSVKSEQSKVPPKQKPHTLDALFANLREQRMKSHPAWNNGWKRVGQQKPLPWMNRFGH